MIVALLGGGWAGLAEAAPGWRASPQLRLEVRRPEFKNDDDVGLLSGSLALSARMPLSEGAVFLVDGYFYRIELDSGSGDPHTRTAFGNPFLGLEARLPGSALFAGAGLRLPVAEEDEYYPLLYGMFADLDRWEAAAIKALPIEATLGFRVRDANGVGMECRLTPTLLHPTEGRYDDEIFLRTVGTLFADGRGARCRLSLLGRAHLTGESGDFGERTFFAVEFSGAVRTGAVWPGLVLQAPLDNGLGEDLTAVIGLSLTYVPESSR